jgi:hypothetical protein
MEYAQQSNQIEFSCSSCVPHYSLTHIWTCEALCTPRIRMRICLSLDHLSPLPHRKAHTKIDHLSQQFRLSRHQSYATYMRWIHQFLRSLAPLAASNASAYPFCSSYHPAREDMHSIYIYLDYLCIALLLHQSWSPIINLRATNLVYLPDVYSYPDEVLERIRNIACHDGLSQTLAAVKSKNSNDMLSKSHMCGVPSLLHIIIKKAHPVKR